jgi:FkbM family methyltransferase
VFKRKRAPSSNVSALVRRGDEANRRRSWQEAEAAYRAALAIDSSLVHIWVQYGHSRKEQGDLEGAEQAYRTSLSLDGSVADTHLQLGHVLKLQGRIDDAADAYVTAYRRDPTLPYPQIELEALGVEVRSRPRFSLEAKEEPEPRDPRPEDILLAHGLSSEFLQIFDFRYYFYANRPVRSALEKPDRRGCLEHFCAYGIEAVLQCSEGYSFDAAFYNEAYLAHCLSPANAYWHWLSIGLEKDWQPNRGKWVCRKLGAKNISAAGLDLDACTAFFYPDDQDAGWTKLFERFIDTDVLRPGPHFPVTEETADLFTAIADRFATGNRDDSAAIIYECVLNSVPTHRRALLNYGDCLRRRELDLGAMHVYQRAIDLEIGSRWSFIHQTMYYEKIGDFRRALSCLLEGSELFPADAQLKSLFIELADRFFSHEWQIAMAIGKSGRYGEAQARLATACDFAASSLEISQRRAPRPLESVAIVASLQLPQCTFYRVAQKLEHVAACRLQSTLYDFLQDLPKFVTECQRHQAVIFYRVPGTPSIIQAINRAKEMGLVTFYDIDDFIFGGDDYPGSFESFLGLITLSDYIGLKLGVPCYRAAISLCDYGLASTPALANEMSGLVLSGQAFVHRNALGWKQEKLSMPLPVRQMRDRVTIFYGSATKSHKEDFRELVEPALVEIVKRHGDRVAIVLVGFTVLSPKLESIQENLTLIGPVSDVDHYWEILRNADINIAVLQPDQMTNCKSELKWLEAAMFGIPSVVSGTVTYNEVVEPGVTGLVCNTVDEWIEALDRLVQDGELRERIGMAARDQARDLYSVPRMAANLASIFARTTPATGGTTRPKIIIVNVFYPPQAVGGATRVVRDNVRWLIELYRDDFDIEVFTSAYGATEDYETRVYIHEGIRVTSVSRPETWEVERALSDGKMQDLFGQYLDELAPALVHFHCIQRLTASVVSAAAERDIPYLITAHDGWWISDVQFIVNEEDQQELYDYENPLATARQWGGEAYGRLMRLKGALFGAAKVLAVSCKFAELYRSCGVPNVVVIENGISDIERKPHVPSPDNRIRLGLLGGIGYAKGSELIRYSLLSEPFEHLRLIVVDGGAEPGNSRCELWNTTPVTFIPKVTEDSVAELYASLDVVLAPSVCIESFGLTTREALHCGCWVVASDRGSIGDCVTPGQNGYVVDVSDPTDLTRVLKLIDTDPQRYREPPPVRPKLRRSAQQTEELAALYRSIIERSAAPAVCGVGEQQVHGSGTPATASDDAVVALELPARYGHKRFSMLNQQHSDLVATTVAARGWQVFERPMPEIFAAYCCANPGLVVDVGINTGFYALLACRVHDGNLVLGFEPDRQVRSRLYQNIRLNALETRILASPLALSDRVGEANLYIPMQHHGLVESSSSLEASFKGEHSEIISIGLSTLDAILSSPLWRKNAVSVIKIDVEGHEHAVLSGAFQIVSVWRPVIFIEILDRGDFAALTSMIGELRYVDIPLRLDELTVKSSVSFDSTAWNHAFVPVEKANNFFGICYEASSRPFV